MSHSPDLRGQWQTGVELLCQELWWIHMDQPHPCLSMVPNKWLFSKDRDQGLEPCFPKCGRQSSSMDIPWALCRNTDPGTPSQSCWPRTQSDKLQRWSMCTVKHKTAGVNTSLLSPPTTPPANLHWTAYLLQFSHLPFCVQKTSGGISLRSLEIYRSGFET